MADKGTIQLLKDRVDVVLTNSRSISSITPQEHNNLLRDVIDTMFPTYGTGLGVDNYSVLLNITQVARQTGKLHLLTFQNTNTANCTLAVDALPSKPLVKEDGSQIGAGEIVVSTVYEVRWYEQFDEYRVNI